MKDLSQKQKDFAAKYHLKVVKPLGFYYNIPIKEYYVTSALLNWEDEKTTIFAIKALDYNLENKNWFTFHIDSETLGVAMSDFEIIRDFDTKPVILDEILMSWGEEEGEYINCTSSIYTPEKETHSRTDKILKKEIAREVGSGLDEYMFIYKSMFDIDKPSCYIVRIPNFKYREQVQEWVKLWREDVLENRVVYGVNKRLLDNEQKI